MEEIELHREFTVSALGDVIRITHECGWYQEFACQSGFEEMTIAALSHAHKVHKWKGHPDDGSNLYTREGAEWFN